MKNYVLGFYFSEDRKGVLLIEKNRPAMKMVGVLNGLGGKIEEKESGLKAMNREFKEECGISGVDWRHFCNFGDLFTLNVQCFVGFGNLEKAKQLTDEKLEIVEVNNLPENYMGNLNWLIPMALDNRFFEVIL